MGHLFALVLVPPTSTDVEAEVATIMAPYNEGAILNSVGPADHSWDYWLVGGRYNGTLVGRPVPTPEYSDEDYRTGNIKSSEGPLELNSRSVASLLDDGSPTWNELQVATIVSPEDGWSEILDFHDFEGQGAYEERWVETQSRWSAHALPLLRKHKEWIAVALDVHR